MRLFIILIIILSLMSCGITRSDVKYKERSVKKLRAKLESAMAGKKATQFYISRLKKNLPPGEFAIYFDKKGLSKLINSYLPYTLKGRDLHKKISGKFIITKVSHLKFLPRNRIFMKMYFKGKNIKFNIKGYAKIKKEVKEALQAGGVADIVVYLSFHPVKNGVKVYARCTKVKLFKHNKSDYTSNIKAQLNAKLLKWPKLIPVPDHFRNKSTFVLTTGNHLIVGYR